MNILYNDVIREAERKLRDVSRTAGEAAYLLRKMDKCGYREHVLCKDCKEWVGGGIDDKDNFIPPMCKRYNIPKHADGFCDEAEKKLQEEM